MSLRSLPLPLQCLVHKDFTLSSDMCIRDPNDCPDGLSLSVWYKGEQGLARDWEYVTTDPQDQSIIEAIVSSGK